MKRKIPNNSIQKHPDEIGFWESMLIAVIIAVMFTAVLAYGVKYAESRRVYWEATK